MIGFEVKQYEYEYENTKMKDQNISIDFTVGYVKQLLKLNSSHVLLKYLSM